MSPYYAVLGIASYGFPFATVKAVVTRTALLALKEFASLLPPKPPPSSPGETGKGTEIKEITCMHPKIKRSAVWLAESLGWLNFVDRRIVAAYLGNSNHPIVVSKVTVLFRPPAEDMQEMEVARIPARGSPVRRKNTLVRRVRELDRKCARLERKCSELENSLNDCRQAVTDTRGRTSKGDRLRIRHQRLGVEPLEDRRLLSVGVESLSSGNWEYTLDRELPSSGKWEYTADPGLPLSRVLVNATESRKRNEAELAELDSNLLKDDLPDAQRQFLSKYKELLTAVIVSETVLITELQQHLKDVTTIHVTVQASDVSQKSTSPAPAPSSLD